MPLCGLVLNHLISAARRDLHANSFRAASACSLQNRMSIARNIVSAAECSRALSDLAQYPA